MKQRLRKLLSGFLCIALIASAFVGALSASVLPAKADLPESDGYLDDLFAEMRVFCPVASLSTFDSIHEQLTDNFDNWLIMIEHKIGSNDWAVVSYSPDMLNLFFYTFYGGEYLFRPRYSSDYYNYNFHSRYGFMIKNGQFYIEPYNTGLGNTNFITGVLSSSDYWQWWYCAPSDVTDQKFECWSNQTLRMLRQGGNWSDNADYIAYLSPNLFNGSYVPPITEYNWFKFQLGDRWYITTVDQSYVNNMTQEDETYYVWKLNIMFEDETFDECFIESSMMVRLPYAQNFISQQLENVSPSGVYAYDVTSWINDSNYVNATSVFYQVFMTPGGYFEWLYIAYSDDVVSFVLTEQQEEQTHNNAWNEINTYIINYPTVSIVPEVLADQLSGHNAVGSGMGGVRAPNQIQQWMNQVYYDTDYFQYDLSIGGLDASYESIINFEILDTIIVPAQNLLTSTSIRYWDHKYQLDNGTIDTYHIGNLDYSNPLFEQYDLILITKADAKFMGDTHVIYSLAGNGANAYVGDIKRADIAHDLYYEPVYWILTNRAIEKSQLYVFCDSQSKLYKLLSDYINKRDLWDSSFFDFTLSLFWQLETIDGYLLRFEQEYKTWDLANKLSSIVTKLQEIADNTSETDVDPWYLALFNWIKAFEPSNIDFIGWVQEYDDFVDDLPDPGGATIIPFPTAAPTALPTVAVAGG